MSTDFARDLKEIHWDYLINQIKSRKCTPFVGAGACHPLLKLGGNIASMWAKKYNYPLKDRRDLPKVGQFVALESATAFPKTWMVNHVQQKGLKDPPATLDLLAKLPLPIYITTNYDDFMFRALENNGRHPRRQLCRWFEIVRGRRPRSDDDQQASRDDNSDYEPTVDEPVVFHLHGHHESLDSMVLTENDYFDFIIAMLEYEDLIPWPIRKAIADSSLLFVGYSIDDVNFRVVFRLLTQYYMKHSLQPSHVSVQLLPTVKNREAAATYLTKYYEQMKIHMYWGNCANFAEQLRRRLREHEGSLELR